MKSFWSHFVIGAFLFLLVGVGIRNALGDDETKGETASMAALEAQKDVDIEALARELQEREKKMEEQARVLKDWEDRLKVQEERIKSQIEELRTLTEQNTKASTELEERQKLVAQNLIKTIESMNPRKAAEVLSVMEQPLAVELLMAMKAKKVAAILDKMDSNKAMLLSSQIAERKPADAR